MAIINLETRISANTGRETNLTPTAFSFLRTISPIMNGITVAAGDIIALKTFSYHNVVDIRMKHFGANATDATFSVDATYGVFDPVTSTVQTDNNGDPVLLTPSFFASGLGFASARNTEFSLQTLEASREVLNISTSIAGLAPAQNSGRQVVLCFVVVTPPTATLELAFKGTTRGY